MILALPGFHRVFLLKIQERKRDDNDNQNANHRDDSHSDGHTITLPLQTVLLVRAIIIARNKMAARRGHSGRSRVETTSTPVPHTSLHTLRRRYGPARAIFAFSMAFMQSKILSLGIGEAVFTLKGSSHPVR